MIKISNLSKSFGENLVIDNLSFELPNCGIVTVTGPSGKGKTTLLNILAGTLQPDSGEIIGDYSSLSYSFQDDRLIREKKYRDRSSQGNGEQSRKDLLLA